MESNEINKTALPPCQFQVIGVPLFDNEMIALAGEERTNISKQMKREELIKMGIPEYSLKCIGDKEHRYVSWFPIQHSFLRY
jgi:hypothetical protein